MSEQTLYSSKKNGMAAREGALRLIHAVLSEKQLLDDAYRAELHNGPLRKLAGNDRAFAKRIVTTVLQHLGEIDDILTHFLDRGMPKKSGPLRNILRIGVAELLYLKVPSHAVVDSAVSHYRTWRKYAGFKGLTNAVLRRVSEKGPAILETLNPAEANLPDWLLQSWRDAYGETATDEIVAQMQAATTPLDLSLKSDELRDHYMKELEGTITPTGSLRLANHGKVDTLAGFEKGDWWVQDAAAALPVKLLGDVKGKQVLDLCAAPGGKTMQLAAAGADATAVDLAKHRLDRIQDNLDRVKLDANLVRADVMKFKSDGKWDAILLDAPCSATGTTRRHPELIHQRSPKDIEHFAALQRKMLRKAAKLLAPNGVLVFCTCSLQPEEGPDHISDFLTYHPEFAIEPIEKGEIQGMDEFIQEDGSMRTRPDQWAEIGALDGFYAIRLKNLAPEE